MPSNKRTAIRGVIWSSIERFSVQGVQFIVSLVLARLLTPDDFGLVAIVLVFSTIFNTINESGFNVALMHKLDRDELDYSTVFFSNLLIGVLSYVFLFFCSPYIASFYDSPRLTPVMRVLSLNIIVNSFGLVQTAKYTIEINFKTLAKASFAASIISGIIGITCALRFHSVFAIVFQQLSYTFSYVVLLWLVSKWKPIISFSINRFRSLFNYAYKLILARLISVVFDDIYSLAIGKIYTPSVLGFYNRSLSFRQVITRNIISVVQRVSTPLLCESQNDLEQMKRVLLKFLANTALFVFPLLAGLMALSKPLIFVLLGEKWAPVSEMLLLGCPCGFFYLISTFNRNVYNATGHTEMALKAEIIKKGIFIIIFLLTFKFNIKVLLIGLILISFLEMIIDTSYSKKQIGITLYEQFAALSKVFVSPLLMALFIWGILRIVHNVYLQLFLGFFAGLLSYGLFCYLFNAADFRAAVHHYFYSARPQ